LKPVEAAGMMGPLCSIHPEGLCRQRGDEFGEVAAREQGGLGCRLPPGSAIEGLVADQKAGRQCASRPRIPRAGSRESLRASIAAHVPSRSGSRD
jgi:hypothetical protein